MFTRGFALITAFDPKSILTDAYANTLLGKELCGTVRDSFRAVPLA